MKYQLSSVKRPAKKPFDFNASVEALADSFDKIGSSYAELVAAEGRVLEVEAVIADCGQALESIKRFGLTAQNMTLLNGSDHSLDRALGLEDLAIESLASLSASHKAMLQSQYVAGLEGAASEMFKNMVERVKQFFAKLFQWLKDVFTGSAKIIAAVEAMVKDGVKPLDAEKKVTALTYDQCVDGLKKIDEMVKGMDKIVEISTKESMSGNPDEEDTEWETKSNDDIISGHANDKAGAVGSFDKKSDTIGALKWDAGKVKSIADQLVSKFKTEGKKFDADWKNIRASYQKELNSNNPKALAKKFKAWQVAQRSTGTYNKIIRAIGTTLMTVAKSEKAAEAK